jgi:sulfoxide reductase heme-binding subunit YedZ
MNNWLWYVTRATGIVATVLMLTSLAWGFLFSARETGTRLRPAWWLDLHKGLGGLAVVFTVIHLVTAFADSDLGVSLATVFVPGAAGATTAAFTWGVLAFYGLAIAVFTSWPKMLFRRRTWRMVHLLSVPATALACVHAYQLGSDANSLAFRVLMPVAVGCAVYPLGVRVWGLVLSESQEDPNRS